MSNTFFEGPIVNSPYENPGQTKSVVNDVKAWVDANRERLVKQGAR